MELDKLVKQYQGGDTSTREAIADLVSDTAGAVIRAACGNAVPGYIEGPAIIEPFNFNDDDIGKVFNNSLDYSLKTYKHECGKKFNSWFYDVFHGRLHNLKEQYIKEQADGETIKNIEAWQQQKEILGDVYDPEVLKQCKFISGDDIEKMNDKQRSFISISIALFDSDKNLTDVAAAEIFRVTEKTIYNWKKELQEILAGSNERRKQCQEDDLPGLFNEYGAKDITPREAAKNIKNAIS